MAGVGSGYYMTEHFSRTGIENQFCFEITGSIILQQILFSLPKIRSYLRTFSTFAGKLLETSTTYDCGRAF
jgi:hypothetical protein